jgi:phage terminase large subunit
MLKPTKEIRAEIDKNLVEVMRGWRERPVDFCRDVLRFEPLHWQIEFMQAVADSRLGKLDKRRFAIRSGTGVGKSAGVACLILWHLACFFDSKIGITAPTAPLLRAVLLPECAKWIRNIPPELKDVFPYDPQTERILLHDNFAVARTSREGQSESMQGLHASNILMIFEEASGVAEASFLASQGVMSEEGAITIYIGNPTRAAGPFFDAFHADSHMFWTKRVGCQDSERVSPKYIEEMREKHGEDSYEFKVRVLGEFSLEDSGVIIPVTWIQEAMNRYVEPDSDYIVWGFDVSDGRDKSALARRCGNKLLGIHAWGGKEVLQSVGMVADWYSECKYEEKPDEICVDAIGMGATAAQRLAEVLKGEPVRITKVNVALTGMQIGERFTSLRVELWDRGRKWFESGLVALPPNATALASQLSSVEWEVKDSNGKWAIVDKKAGGGSPDMADSFLLTFAGLKRGKSSFTKDSKGRKIVTSNETTGVGSASYLNQGASHDYSRSHWNT